MQDDPQMNFPEVPEAPKEKKRGPLYIRRWRFWSLLILPLLVLIAQVVGPDGWRYVAGNLLWISNSCFLVVLAYLGRKALFDYVSGIQAYRKAMETSEGASRVVLGICIVVSALFLGLVSFSKVNAAEVVLKTSTAPSTVPQTSWAPIPPNALTLMSTVNEEIDKYWPAIPRRSYVGALIEIESCITVKHKSCWNPSARLKTDREEGGSLGQFTRAWAPNGALRFDAVAEVKALAPKDLAEFSWDTIYSRADLSIRAILIKSKDCHRRFGFLAPGVDSMVVLAFCDAAYNGGYQGMLNDRKLCALQPNGVCDPMQWFDHTEHYSNKSKTKWQGYGRSAFDINRHHVRETVPLEPPSRREKYVPFLGV